MDWWRHMMLSSNWLEIHNVESVREYKSIPTNHIKWVVRVRIERQMVPSSNQYFILTSFLMNRQLSRWMEIPLFERCMLHQLPIVIAISFRSCDFTIRNYSEDSNRELIKVKFINRPARNNHIIQFLKWNGSKHGLNMSTPIVNKVDFISVRVLKKVRHLLSNVRLVPLQIRVPHQTSSSGNSISFWTHLVCLQVKVTKRLVFKINRST